MFQLPARLLPLLGLALLPSVGQAAEPLVVTVTHDMLDSHAYAEWVDGMEKPIRPKDERDRRGTPDWVVGMADGVAGYNGIEFGRSKTPGPRHLRVAFHVPLRVGSVLALGGGRLSVLRPEVAGPGDLADDRQWIDAERITPDGKIGRAEAGPKDYAVWTLPQAIATRAIRFTHVAVDLDRDYAGSLGGAYLLPERMANLGPQAIASAGSNDKEAGRLVNEQTDGTWQAWSNIPEKEGWRSDPVSPQSPEWIMLTWPRPVQIHGLAALWAGFAEAEVQAYSGPGDVHPRDASDRAWRAIGRFTGLKNRYPSALAADFLDFGREVSTRAVRLRMTKAIDDRNHPHVYGRAHEGRRVWLGELMALTRLGSGRLETALLPKQAGEYKPPLAIRFTMPAAGWATLVIEDSEGKRVRNLVADTWFDKGENIVGWDGSDDLGRDLDAPRHGVYMIPAHLVAPGRYQVRGLWRKQVDLRYEFPVYTAGNPPWNTADTSGGWLANHTAPGAVAFVPDMGDGRPAVLIGSYVSEGTAGLAWVDLQGHKLKGKTWIGGAWTGAQHLARDAGPRPVPKTVAYAAASWSIEENPRGAKSPAGEIRVTAITVDGDKPVTRFTFTPPPGIESAPAGEARWERHLGGLAACNGLVAFSMPVLGQIVLIDAQTGRTFATAKIQTPRGLAFDGQGRLLAVSGRRLVRLAVDPNDPQKLGPAETLVAEAAGTPALEEPQGLCLDSAGDLYVSDRGTAHQVKVFSPQGKLLRTIGKRGLPAAGPYDPQQMNNPLGLTVDGHGRLWVAEEDFQPKRVSVWNPDGTLWRAFYGPPEYGGGGRIDPYDPNRFYYLGMEFRLDWRQGRDELVRVLDRCRPNDPMRAFRAGMPEMPVELGGRHYFTNCYNSNPTGGCPVAMIWLDRGGTAVPVASLGRADLWELFKGDAFRPRWPAGVDLTKDPWRNPAMFVWSDLNGDGQVQPEEVTFLKAASGGVTVMSDLAFAVARVDDNTRRYAPLRFTDRGVPVYDLERGEVLAEGAQKPPSSGGDQVLVGPDGWTIHTNAPRPFSAHGVGGARHGVALWSYPSLWPGLHASHEAPVPEQPGTMIGHTRLLGGFVTPPGEAGPLWLLNGNHGNVYVFTIDGLFVAQLFQDMRVGRQWAMPVARRGMLLNDLTMHDENFWPSVTQTPKGEIYLYSGGHQSIVRIDGLETVRRIPPQTLDVTTADLDRARESIVRAEIGRQAAHGKGVLVVALPAEPPKVDGRLDDWARAQWVDIDKRGVAAYFNSTSRPFDVTGTVAIAGERLYAAWRTGDKDLLKNSGETPLALFKTGGALDLMIGCDPAADPKRTKPAVGDARLLVTRVGERTRAMLYRAVVPGSREPVPFASPVRTIHFDRVEDVSSAVELAASGDGDYEISVPLAVLGLRPVAGMTLRGDIGILRGDNFVTRHRVYWSNKATAITADVPSEAELLPALWGKWEIR